MGNGAPILVVREPFFNIVLQGRHPCRLPPPIEREALALVMGGHRGDEMSRRSGDREEDEGVKGGRVGGDSMVMLRPV